MLQDPILPEIIKLGVTTGKMQCRLQVLEMVKKAVREIQILVSKKSWSARNSSQGEILVSEKSLSARNPCQREIVVSEKS